MRSQFGIPVKSIQQKNRARKCLKFRVRFEWNGGFFERQPVQLNKEKSYS